MTLEVAYNFNHRQPEIIHFSSPAKEVFETRERFVVFISQPWELGDIYSLSNVSCCIYANGEKVTLPSWYLECNGKIFFEPLEEDRLSMAIKAQRNQN